MPTTIVVADDDPGFRRVAAELLTSRGFSVIGEATDGASTISAVRTLLPDGLLLDLHLPDLDGMAVARTITACRGPMKILMTSADRLWWTDTELAEAGVNRFVTKERLLDIDLAEVFGEPSVRSAGSCGAGRGPARN